MYSLIRIFDFSGIAPDFEYFKTFTLVALESNKRLVGTRERKRSYFTLLDKVE